ncbi:MAG: hypothetical protein NVS3B16_22300 [Vulcanimicrobiaceae bacterium]
MLETLARLLANRPVVIVAAFRSGRGSRAPALRSLHRRLGADVATARIFLAPLERPAIASLLAGLRGTAVDDRITDVLAERSSGNPLFLQELLRDAERDDGFELSRLLLLPARVSETILARVAGASEGDRAMLAVAAVFGLAVGVDLIASAVGLSDGVVQRRLDAFVDLGVLTLAGSRTAGDYTFSHHLVRDTIYEQLDERERPHLHRRVAEVLIAESEHWQQIPVGEIAHHLQRAGDPTAAVWHVRAARNALAVCAFDDAAHHAASATHLATDGRVRYEATAILDDVARLGGNTTARATLLERLRGIATGLDDATRFDAIVRCADAGSMAADGEKESEAIDELQALAIHTARSRHVLARLQARRALRLGRYDEARAHVAAADAIASDAEASPAERVELRAMLAEMAALAGNRDEAARFATEARTLCEESGEPAAHLRVLRMTQHVLFAQLQFDASIRAGEAVIAAAHRLGDVVTAADAHAKIAPASARLFRVAAARENFAAAADAYRRIGNRQALAALAINEAVFLIHLGRVDDAAERCTEAEREFRIVDDLRGRTVAALNRSVIELRRGALATALRHARAALRLARRMRDRRLEAYALANVGGIERHRGAAATAVETLRDAIALRREVGSDVDLVTDLTEYSLALVATGDVAAARRACDELRAVVARTNDVAKDPQFALWSVAQTLRALGETTAAREALEAANVVLAQRAAAIPDEPSRDAFLRFAMNPEIRRAAESDDFRTTPV